MCGLGTGCSSGSWSGGHVPVFLSVGPLMGGGGGVPNVACRISEMGMSSSLFVHFPCECKAWVVTRGHVYCRHGP